VTCHINARTDIGGPARLSFFTKKFWWERKSTASGTFAPIYNKIIAYKKCFVKHTS